VSDRQLGEHSHVISDRVQKMRERWNNRLTFPPTDLGERYVRGELQLWLRCCHGVHPFPLFVKAADDERSKFGRERSSQIPETNDQNQRVMFVFAVKLIEDEKWIVHRVRSVVGLEPFDEVTCGGRIDPLYLSTVTGDFVFGSGLLSTDGEGDRSLVASPICIAGEHPDQVIEHRPQMVRDLACHDSKTRRDYLMGVDQLLRHLLPVVTASTFAAFLEKGCDLDIQITDTLVGPI